MTLKVCLSCHLKRSGHPLEDMCARHQAIRTGYSDRSSQHLFGSTSQPISDSHSSCHAPHATKNLGARRAGLASCRYPADTARIAAAAASSRARARRPPWLFFANLQLPSGSTATRASAMAARISRPERGTTPPSRQARRKALTSSPPSWKPCPRVCTVAIGTHAASSASRSSASRQRLATTAAGLPSNC